MTLPTPVTWMEIKDAARLARVPIKTVYRWAQRDDVRRLRLLGRVLVVWEDIVYVRELLRGDAPNGPPPCIPRRR